MRLNQALKGVFAKNVAAKKETSEVILSSDDDEDDELLELSQSILKPSKQTVKKISIIKLCLYNINTYNYIYLVTRGKIKN